MNPSGLGFRGLQFRGLQFRGLGFRGLGLRESLSIFCQDMALQDSRAEWEKQWPQNDCDGV